MSGGIQGKVVLITGGAGGIGSEAARVLASKGARLAVADINEQKLDEVVEGIKSVDGNAKGYYVDVTHKDRIKLTVDAVVSDFGKLDVLINSAGIMLIRPLTEVNTAEWETTIDLNVLGHRGRSAGFSEAEFRTFYQPRVDSRAQGFFARRRGPFRAKVRGSRHCRRLARGANRSINPGNDRHTWCDRYRNSEQDDRRGQRTDPRDL